MHKSYKRFFRDRTWNRAFRFALNNLLQINCDNSWRPWIIKDPQSYATIIQWYFMMICQFTSRSRLQHRVIVMMTRVNNLSLLTQEWNWYPMRATDDLFLYESIFDIHREKEKRRECWQSIHICRDNIVQ